MALVSRCMTHVNGLEQDCSPIPYVSADHISKTIYMWLRSVCKLHCCMSSYHIGRTWRQPNYPTNSWGWGLGAFLRWWPLSTLLAGPLSFYGHHRGGLNNPIFSNLGLCATCWAHFMCHHELWPTSVSHPFSFLNSSLGLAGGKHYQKITIPVFRFVLQNFTIRGYFPYILFYCCTLSLLSSGWFVIAVQYVPLFQSGN